MDIFDVLCHHWFVTGKPSRFQIDDSMLQQYRGKLQDGSDLERQRAAMQEIGRFFFSHKDRRYPRGPLVTCCAIPTQSPITERTRFSYEVVVGDLLQGKTKNRSFTPEHGAYYHSGVWGLHPIRDRLARRLIRHLRLEWRQYADQYCFPDGEIHHPWSYHLQRCGLDLKAEGKRPSEFYNLLNRALWILIDKGYLHGQNHSNESEKADQDWHDCLYKSPDAPPARLQNRADLFGHGGFANFLLLEVQLLPPQDISEQLKKKVAGRKKGRNAQHLSRQRQSSVEDQ